MNEIKRSLKTLNANKPFFHFNIPLSAEEADNLHKIRIDTPKFYDNFGEIEYLTNQLDDFIKSLNQHNHVISPSLAILIKNLVDDILLSFGKETAWVSVRASIATTLWDIPRWHTDGYYYLPYKGEQYKVVITLKGPATLFYPLPNELREKFNSLQFDPKNRFAIASMLDASQSISALPGQGTIYLVGANDSAVHSEPATHEERLFLSIVPGSKAAIKELYNNWQIA